MHYTACQVGNRLEQPEILCIPQSIGPLRYFRSQDIATALKNPPDFAGPKPGIEPEGHKEESNQCLSVGLRMFREAQETGKNRVVSAKAPQALDILGRLFHLPARI